MKAAAVAKPEAPREMRPNVAAKWQNATNGGAAILICHISAIIEGAEAERPKARLRVDQALDFPR